MSTFTLFAIIVLSVLIFGLIVYAAVSMFFRQAGFEERDDE